MTTELIEALTGKDWGLLINGASQAAADNAWDKVYSPATGLAIAQVARATETDVDAAVQNAKAAFVQWAALPGAEREKIIRKATAYVRTQADQIGGLMALEQGKPFAQSRGEVTSSCDLMDYYAAEAVRVEGYVNSTEKSNLYSWVVYQPVGVCGLITPWNYPVSLLSWKLGPAMATGCTVVVKPTEVTPLSPLAFCKALIEGGIPAGVINVVMGDGVVGAALVTHRDVAKVAMTGSTHTGKKIMSAIASQLKKVSLELGGHCPAIVCADADLDLAAEIIVYKGFRNMGQSCSTVNRVYAHHSIHDVLIEKIVSKAQKFSIGDGVLEGDCDLGPMTTAETLQKVERHVADALTKGASLHTGGKKPNGEKYQNGHYYTPTVLSKVSPDMLMMQEETFGPVVPIDSFDSLEEAIDKANDSDFGLCAYLFTKDFATTMRVSQALEAGTVCVNNGAVNTAYAPYEGWKDSGFGVELSRKAIFEYLKTKHIKVGF
ncbi:NAD-dependent succinate-semialdehyde dehydrogenase [Haliscomenobacter sp.]|uniref:aldehyde dehydrogenase family protein n=1 Tax=Haliscomenobacter sp. TaxID=2717303 RepID=UPI0033651A0B